SGACERAGRAVGAGHRPDCRSLPRCPGRRAAAFALQELHRLPTIRPSRRNRDPEAGEAMRTEAEHARRSPAVQRLLVGLVDGVTGHPWLVLGLALALCAVSLYAAATRLEYHTSRDDLVSPHKDFQKRWRHYLTEFGDDDDMVVVIQGKDRPRMEKAIESV